MKMIDLLCIIWNWLFTSNEQLRNIFIKTASLSGTTYNTALLTFLSLLSNKYDSKQKINLKP